MSAKHTQQDEQDSPDRKPFWGWMEEVWESLPPAEPYARKWLAWGQELLGAVVEPAAGWIVVREGRLLVLDEQLEVVGAEPVFPPPGFAGLTDQELFRALADDKHEFDLDEGVALVGDYYPLHVQVRCDGRFGSKYHNAGSVGISCENLARYEVALTNAQVLIARLADENDA